MAFDNTSLMQAIFDRETDQERIETVGAIKVAKKSIRALFQCLFFVIKNIISLILLRKIDAKA